jgi:PAS domain S-box-containing protein
MSGLSVEQIVGSAWLDAFHPDDVDVTMAAISKSLATGKPIDIEFHIKSPGGGWRWVRTRGWPLRGPSGEVDRWYGATEDVDDRGEKVTDWLN